MAALIKALLQPVAIVWLGLLVLCVWQIYKRHYRLAAVPGALFLFVFITGSSPLAGYLLAWKRRMRAPIGMICRKPMRWWCWVELPLVRSMRLPG